MNVILRKYVDGKYHSKEFVWKIEDFTVRVGVKKVNGWLEKWRKALEEREIKN